MEFTALHAGENGKKASTATSESTIAALAATVPPPDPSTALPVSSGVIYPPGAVNNPLADLNEVRTDPILGELRRPAFVPEDLDSRIDRASVWIAVVPNTSQAIYFVPASCGECQKLAQHCDRGDPCSRCSKRGVKCEPGVLRHYRLASSQPAGKQEDRLTAAEKGKGRATAEESAGIADEDEEGGRGMRVKKKRRLSASDELDPTTLSWDGSSVKKPRSKPRPSAVNTPLRGPLQPEDVQPTDADGEYYAALKVNDERPLLDNMRGFCPLWSDRRQALTAACKHFENSYKVAGASVSVGTSGVARGVILDSTPVGSVAGSYFGMEERAGTIVTSIGSRRTRRDITATPAAEYEESTVVKALIMAQRARIPVAVAVSQCSPLVPFKVPRDVVALGWFWVVDAWTELVSRPGLVLPGEVVWKFRFEWCDGEQGQPWWVGKDVPERQAISTRPASTPPVEVRGGEAGKPTTLRGSTQQRAAVGADETILSTRCDCCKTYSDVIYEGWTACLNEHCPIFCMDAPDVKNSIATQKSDLAPRICPIQSLALPEDYGLKLMPPDPSVMFADTRREDAQRDLWRAWVCKRCRMANERRDWFGFLCEACSYLQKPKRKVYSVGTLRPPSRPVSTGPRPDEGYSSWDTSAVRASQIFPDGVKAITHGLSTSLGNGTQVSHLLNHDGASEIASNVVLALQGQDLETPFRRHMLSAESSRASDLRLCRFYTYLVGPDVPFIPSLPCGIPVEWSRATKAVTDAMEFTNERAGRVAAGAKKFNSLLLAAVPPAAVSLPIPVPGDTLSSLLVLGGDAVVRFRRQAGSRGYAGQVTAQHGDVLVIRSGQDDLEIEVKTEGFGFVGLARMAYPKDGEPEQQPQSQTPYAAWYVGAYPCDPTQPLRPLPALREAPETDEVDPAEVLKIRPFRGQEVRWTTGRQTVREAPESGPLPKAAEEEDTGAAAAKRGGKAKAKGRGARAASGTPRGRGKARGRGGRASGSRTASASASASVAPEDEPSAAAESVQPSPFTAVENGDVDMKEA